MRGIFCIKTLKIRLSKAELRLNLQNKRQGINFLSLGALHSLIRWNGMGNNDEVIQK